VLDGGHNQSAAEALALVARGWADRPLWLVMGALNTRDPRAFVEPLAPHVAGLRAVPIPGEAAALPPEAIVKAARGCGVAAEAAADVGAALDAIAAAHESGQETGRVLICGSLYLAGQVLALNGTPPAFEPLRPAKALSRGT
jgi:dihydrofolate synthase/folylpolyglutamate synthase